jgi:hypothetical protein
MRSDFGDGAALRFIGRSGFRALLSFVHVVHGRRRAYEVCSADVRALQIPARNGFYLRLTISLPNSGDRMMESRAHELHPNNTHIGQHIQFSTESFG